MEDLLATLAARFKANPTRHPNLSWEVVATALSRDPQALKSITAMEASGGEPDVVSLPTQSGLIFVDCAPESPQLRRSLCYDQAALEKRKANKPAGSALAWAFEHHVQLLTPEQYQELQAFGPFDQKTSSWVVTPPEVREQGGALFGDYRYGTTFIYHNGADSYYASRGFRVMYVIAMM